MSYKNDSELVILNKYGKASGIAKSELYETYDRIRDLTDSGPAMGGSGLGKFGSMLMNVARMVGGGPFIPTFGSEAINVPGTSYYTPITGGNGVVPGGNAAFGLAPFSQYSGFPMGGAAPVGGSGANGGLWNFAANGIGSMQNDIAGIGDLGGGLDDLGAIGSLAGGTIAGGASPIGGVATGAGLALGTTAGAGFGRNWVMPAAGIMSGIGGLLTTLGPFFGPFGLAGVAAGSVLNGASGAVLASFQHVSQRIISNADIILSEKVKNIESVVKMLDAQQDILKKIVKEGFDGDKKALDNI